MHASAYLIFRNVVRETPLKCYVEVLGHLHAALLPFLRLFPLPVSGFNMTISYKEQQLNIIQLIG